MLWTDGKGMMNSPGRRRERQLMPAGRTVEDFCPHVCAGLGKTPDWVKAKTCTDTVEAVPDPNRQIKTVRHHLRDTRACLKTAGR